MRKCFQIALLYFVLQADAFSQGTVFNYPVQFSQVAFSKSIVNPALVCLHSPVDIFSGTQQYTGYFSDISTQYVRLGIQIPIENNTRRPRNILSLRFTNDQEGAYISRNRGYVGYSFHTRLFGDYNFGGAIEVGSMGYFVQGTPSTGNASKYIIDGSAGISVYNELLTTGISMNQAFNNQIQPLDEVTRLYRHMNVFVSNYFNVSEFLGVNPYALYRFPIKGRHKYNLDIGGHAILIDKLMVGGAFRYKKGASFSVGLTNFELLNGFLTLGLAYNSPFGRSSLNISIFEIHINYKYLKKGSVTRLPSLP